MGGGAKCVPRLGKWKKTKWTKTFAFTERAILSLLPSLSRDAVDLEVLSCYLVFVGWVIWSGEEVVGHTLQKLGLLGDLRPHCKVTLLGW